MYLLSRYSTLDTSGFASLVATIRLASFTSPIISVNPGTRLLLEEELELLKLLEELLELLLELLELLGLGLILFFF